MISLFLQSPALTLQSPQTWTEPATGIEFVWVPGGCFEMGCVSGVACGSDEHPVHWVCLNGFWMGKYEVTQGQWQQVMERNPSYFNKDKVGRDTSNHPVEQVSWNDVQEFLWKLNEQAEEERYRLPSEAEWEYAARAGTETLFCFGNEAEKLSEYAWYDNNSDGQTHPVGTRRPNAWGLYDMHGNVWEWCQDWYDSTYYSKSPSKNPHRPSSGNFRVLRGGSWYIYPWYCRSAFRLNRSSDVWYRDIGFRITVRLLLSATG